MRLPLLLLGMTAILVASPPAAQTTFENEEEPFFIGRVNDSPIPARKTTAPPDDTTEDGGDETPASDDAPAADDSPAGDVAATTGVVTGDGAGDDAAKTAAAGGADDTTTSPDGATIETRTLPVLRRTEERKTGENDAGGRIKSVPDPDADPEERGDSRFVRAPASRSFDPANDGSPGAPIPAVETALQKGAKLRQLDKMTGQIVTFDIAVGQTLKVARLSIHLDACRSPGDNDTHGVMAHLIIKDTKHEDAKAVFAGWMFAESPALSALDHPRYDLWVISCTTVSADASAGSE